MDEDVSKRGTLNKITFQIIEATNFIVLVCVFCYSTLPIHWSLWNTFSTVWNYSTMKANFASRSKFILNLFSKRYVSLWSYQYETALEPRIWFVLMSSILVRGFKPISKAYFATASSKASEQFIYFISLVSWLFGVNQISIQVNKYDDPMTASQNVIMAL